MREFLTTADIGEQLGVSRQHVARLVKRRLIPAIRSGRCIRVPRPAWEAFLASQTEAALAGMTPGERPHA